MKTTKRLTLMLAALILAGGLAVVPAQASGAATDIKVFVNHELLTPDVPPFIYNDRTMVPLRAIAEALGFEVNWNPETRTVRYFNHENVLIVLTIGSDTVAWGDTTIEIEAPPTIVGDRTFVPLRFIAESFDIPVDWDDYLREVYVGEIPSRRPVATPQPQTS